MLEGAVARFLNQLLGKYVVDLDLENLNVGIFSGKVQLTDLKLNPEALYELNLPIEVKAGTIGRIWLQIPWTSLWDAPVIVNIENVLIVAVPVVRNQQFDCEKNKRLMRAQKRKAIQDLDNESHVIGGPAYFSQHLVTNILNNLQLNITNIHIRYEDDISSSSPIAAGICIGSVTAETTNSKWKRIDSQHDTKGVNAEATYYLVKVDALAIYWDNDVDLVKWNLPSQYYEWRNAMSSSLQHYVMNNENFDFILKPMTAKIKTTIKKSSSGVTTNISSDLVMQDCFLQLTKSQFDTVIDVTDSMQRMLISQEFLSIRPAQKIGKNIKAWWKYTYNAVLEQRVLPYTWSRIKKVRQYYRAYVECYKQIILNPNDTELKLDLQKYEDNLSLVNVVIARQQARLLVKSRSIGEKNFWSMLPSPERLLLCEKIGFFANAPEDYQNIDHKFTVRIGNLNLSILNDIKEVLALTLTQASLVLRPVLTENTYTALFKVEGLIVEGASTEEHLIPIISSEHLANSPAYFLKIELEKLPLSSFYPYKLNLTLDSVECVFNKDSLEEVEKFLNHSYFCNYGENINCLGYFYRLPHIIYDYGKKALIEKWDISCNIKLPFLVIPDTGSCLKADNLLIIDPGRYFIRTEICENSEIEENATQMELEEQLYSKLLFECSDMQVLFCDTSDNWRDARKEKDTELHIVSKSSLMAMYAYCVKSLKTIPNYKFNINFHALKLNISERKIGLFLKYFNIQESLINNNVKNSKSICPYFINDVINGKITVNYLEEVQSKVTIVDNFIKVKRNRTLEKIEAVAVGDKKKSMDSNLKKENLNEAYARCIDLPGLDDNISPNNNITTLCRFVVNELSVVFSRSSDSTDRQYLMFRIGLFTFDIALMTYGPAYQISVNSVLLTDKLHTNSSGQYLDLIHSPLPTNTDVLTVLYRKVSADCPEFWSHFHGVETSLVADFGTLHVLVHQEAVHTIFKYSKYLIAKIKNQIPPHLSKTLFAKWERLSNILHGETVRPVPPGSVKFSHSGRLSDLHIRLCNSDDDIINVQISGMEMDFLFRANERFVFRSFLSNVVVEHLSDVTLYPKVLYADEDKVYEVKYVRYASNLKQLNDISPSSNEDNLTDGSFKFNLGQIHVTFLYKLVVQLQRFFVNLDAVPYVQKLAVYASEAVKKATDTLKGSAKIHQDITICGPVLLFPQKSSSPNVVIVDTGHLHIENFFKEYTNDLIENILLKWSNIMISRGQMTLTSVLELQEALVEPVQLNMDIKRYINISTLQKSWDVDGVLDMVRVTLGQQDIVTIFSIFADNIGEGQILNIFPQVIKSPTDLQETDATVKTLEAFFSEPKQKQLTAKFAIDGMKIMLFFDNGELLSSPIRDLNHGFCKLAILNINTSFIVYTDKSMDGKMSVENLFIEETGPGANVLDKGILQSPKDESKNNNCHVTINKPPIVDITFHQTKSSDKSIDVIVGRLSLNLSVPFCEKLSLFIIECLPKETIDLGFINHGYEGEFQSVENFTTKRSLTVAFRLNKPEFIFLVETTSNKKRYFITKSEILADYSRHGTRLNVVVSLSGLHSLFHDLGPHAGDPYVILRHCDIELCNNYSEEKGAKISASISSLYIRICSAIVHSLNDVLNDITEHFKIPDEIPDKRRRRSERISESEDLWEPKILNAFAETHRTELLDSKICKQPVTHEILLIPKFDIVVTFELEEIQVLLFKSTLEVTVYDWSRLLNCTCEFTMQANYYNEGNQCWEPFIDPVVVDEREYKPWDVLVKVFQDKSLPMLQLNSEEGKLKRGKKPNKAVQSTPTTTDEDDSGEDMMYLEPANAFSTRNNRRVKTSLSTFLDDSDSENEDGTMEKLAAAISDLFTGDWNESEDSDCVQSTDADDESDENIKTKTFEQQEYVSFKKSTYILIDSKETLNITITPTLLKLFNDIFTVYSSKTLSIITNKKSVNLVNDIGPNSKVELFEKRTRDGDEENILICSRDFENEDSPPNSPTKNFIREFCDEIDDRDSATDDVLKEDEMSYDFAALSSLQFPLETTTKLYKKINKNFLKVHIPNFLPLQTNCSKNTWEKLLRLHPVNPSQTYYLAAKHRFAKNGRNIVIGSPLMIKNETCFALNILYQPSVLQQLNLEPLGDMPNPFATTMRIAVLEAYESYNVSMYIAYHCQLFVQPAYAESHSASTVGIWWKDLATDLDTPHNVLCKPKNDDNQEVFSLRVMLRRNLEVKNSLVHSIPNYVIHLLPPLIIHNYLPYTLEVKSQILKQWIRIEPGEKSSVYSLDLSKDQKLSVRVIHNAIVWNGCLSLTTHLDEKIIALSTEGKDNMRNIAINVKADREDSCNIYFYTSFWIINKTGLPLQIKASASNSIMNCTAEDILLFTYKRHGKQTLSVQVYDSNWSNEFGLECADTTGLIVCKDNERKKKYLFFLSIRLSQMCPRLTKIVTILPSFLVINRTDQFLKIMEHNEKTDLWIDLPPFKTVIFWPETTTMQMYVKYRDSKLSSQAFFIASPHRTVLRMDRGGAISVDVGGGVSDSFKITFTEYKSGDAPVLVKNFCADLFLKIQQQDQSQVTLLNPYHRLMYTWDDPTRPRQLVWNVYNNKGSGFLIDISRDGFGEEKIRFHSVTPTTSTTISSSSDDSDSSDSLKTAMKKRIRRDKITIHWLCYRDGVQRTLLFTQDLRIYNATLQNFFQVQCDFESLVSLAGFGMSIFTSETSKKEHVYACLSDMPAIWEVNVGHKWKTLTLELASWIEDKYRLHYKKCQLKDYIHIDFEKMFMLKPFFAELRRTYSPSVYFHYRKSKKEQYFNLKLHSLQIDNKISNCLVLHPLPKNDLKSTNYFIDVTAFKTPSTVCDIYRYIKISVGDFYLNIENDLFLDLGNLFGQKKFCGETTTTAYVNDMNFIRDLITKPKETSQRNIIVENLLVTSFGIQLNICNRKQISLKNGRLPFSKFLNYLFPMTISPCMPMEGVYHRISSIEHVDICTNFYDYLFLLFEEATTQFLQQYYSHILGLQVLINTFAIQPSISFKPSQGDFEKMAGILFYGSRCLLGHINMSPAALETSVTDIFVNQTIENIQRIRRHGSYRRSEVVPKSITLSSRNFHTGVPNALNQLIIRNQNQNSEVNSDGEIFFRTTGKALLSLVTRHPDEKSDSVELAKEALRRASLLGEPIRIHQRLTRYRNKYLGLKPMSVYESIGHHLLESVSNCQFKNDTYWAHVATDKIGKSIVIVSLEHVIRINKCRLWGPWELEWTIELDDIISIPKIVSSELIFNIRQVEDANYDQLKITGDKEILCWLHEKIEQAIIVSMEDKSWTFIENKE